MKKTIFSILIISFMFSSCETEQDKEKTEDLGKQAAIEFCDCYKESSKDDCLDKLKSNYSAADYMSNDFIEAFNKQSSCGITLEIIQLPTKARHYGIMITEK